MPTYRTLAALPLLLLLAACGKGPPQPVTSLADQACPIGANKSRPLVPAEFDKPGGGGASAALFNSRFTTIDIRADISCAEINGTKTTIAIVNLPDYSSPYKLLLSTVMIRTGAVWPPMIEVQDADRKTLRTIPFDSFNQVNDTFLIALYPKPGDRFLFLRTDVSKLGNTGTYLGTVAGAPTIVVPINGVYVPIPGTPDTQEDMQYRFAHNGVIRAAIHYIDAKDVPANAP